jgi:hypothetical protein
VRCQYAAHDILVDLDAERVRNLMGDAQIPEGGVARLERNNGSDEVLSRTLRAGGLRGAPAAENRRRYFLSTNALWNRNKVLGLRIVASFATRLGSRRARSIQVQIDRPRLEPGRLAHKCTGL